MKKKMMIAMLGTSIALSGCVQDVPKVENPSDITKIEKTLPTLYKGLHIDMQSYLVDQTLTVKTTIQNQSDQTIPLHYEKNRFATISLTAEEEVIQEVILPLEKSVLNAKEDVVFETNYVLPNIDKEYVIQAKLHLENQSETLYEEKELFAVESVRKEKQQELVFLPKGKTTYVYEDKRNEEITEHEETFLYFKDGFVQSLDSTRGTNIYYVDQKGVYFAYQNKTVQEENLIGEVDYNKQLVLSFPIKLGTNWEQDGVHYEITALEQSLSTPIGEFADVVEVTSNFGTGVKYYYQKDVGLLEVRVKNGDKWETTTKLVEKK